MKRETRRYGIAFAVLLVLLGGLLIWNLNAGSFPMTASPGAGDPLRTRGR